MFTLEQIEEIHRKLQLFGVKDKDLPILTEQLNGNEIITVVKDGRNVQLLISQLLDFNSFTAEQLESLKGPKGDDGKNAYQTWLSQGNVGTYDDYIAVLQLPALLAAETSTIRVNNKLNEADGVIEELNSLADQTQDTLSEINIAKDLAYETVTHPPVIINKYWHSWNHETNQYDTTYIKAEGDSAYQVWLDAGNTGTVEDYLEDIKGEKGDSGVFIGSDEPTNSEVDVWIDTDDEEVVNIENMVNTTYSNLINLRNNKQLIPGIQYRITDYSTTTVQENTQSAGHQFDIIVTADSVDKLNENARACLHEGDNNGELLSWFEHSKSDPAERFFYKDSVVIEGLTLYRWISQEELNNGSDSQYLLTEMKDVGIGDIVWGYQIIDDGEPVRIEYEEGHEQLKTIINVGEEYMPGTEYFANSKLEAWQLKYSLDNDTTRFAWADDVNGKGVIYRMVDEFNNDCPYDFKNIQFKRKLTDGELDLDSGIDTWVYTFTMSDTVNGKLVDISLKQNTEYIDDEGQYRECANNIIKEAILDYQPDGLIRIQLNDNVFLNINEGYSYYGCYSNTLGNNCVSNTFGDSCYNNTFGNNCRFNTFGYSCEYNTLVNSCSYNTFGDGCSYNTFGKNCRSNTFGNECIFNMIGKALKFTFVKNAVCGVSSNKKDWTSVTDLYNKAYCIEISGFRATTNVVTTNTWRYFDTTGTEVKGTF